MTKSVGVHEAKTHLSRLLEEVENGAEVEIARRGVVVARLVPARPPQRSFGADRGAYTVPSDFDSPLTEDLLNAFGA
jgi:prevent-host-death family protein